MKLSDMTYEQQQEQIAKKLVLCTQQQQEIFHKLYPSGPSQEQMNWAYTQIENTLSKNIAAKQAEVGSSNTSNRIVVILKKIRLWPW